MAEQDTSRQKRPDVPPRRRATDADRDRGLAMLEGGAPIAVIARELDVDRKTVRAWRDSPAGVERVLSGIAERARHAEAAREARARASHALTEATLHAAQILIDALDSADPAERRMAAESILDRNGMPRATKVEATVSPGEDLSAFTDEELAVYEALKSKARAQLAGGGK